MTCRMASIQQKKRSAGSNMQDVFIGKRKVKLKSSDSVLKLRSHIDLKWDDIQKKVIPKEEQVGISWSDLSCFIDSITRPRSGLADVFSVPREIFDLENMNSILTNEVWASCLTEADRNFLTQFLPSQMPPEQVVFRLLKGENHHFGSPFLKWSSSLCSGMLHPDAVVHAEQEMRTNKIAYCTQLNKYHEDMLVVLQKWKERWLSCSDPEKFLRLDGKGIAVKSLEVQDNMESKSLRKLMPQKTALHNDDTTTYMSCIKVSRMQYNLVKSMRSSGDGIQPKLLKRVLGDIENFRVQTYQTYKEEEELKLHDHWFQVACKDLPASYEVWKERKLLLEGIRKSLVLEFAERTTNIMDDYTAVNFNTVIEETGEYDSTHSSRHLSEEMEGSDSVGNVSFNIVAGKIGCSSDGIHGAYSDNQEDEDRDINGLGSSNTAMQDHWLVNAASSENYKEQDSPIVDLEESGYTRMPSMNDSSAICKSSEENASGCEVMETNDVVNNQEWQSVNTLESYYCADNQMYSQSTSLALKPPHICGREQPLVDRLESSLTVQNGQVSAPPSFHVGHSASIFHPPLVREQNEQFGTLAKNPEVVTLSYNLPHTSGMKQTVIDMAHLTSNALPVADHFPGLLPELFPEQKQLMDYRNNGLSVPHFMNKSTYAPTSRFLGQETYPLVEQPNFAARSNVNGNFCWFSGESQSHNRLSRLDPLNGFPQCLPGVGSGDGSLFSVLSQCNSVGPRSRHSNTSTCQYIQSKNFMPTSEAMYACAQRPPIMGMTNLMPAGALSTNNAAFQVALRDLLSTDAGNHVASVDPSVTNLQWMNFPQQSPGLPDPMNGQHQGPWGR